MSEDEHNPFRWVPTLKHIAKVRIIEAIWRRSSADVKNWVDEYPSKFSSTCNLVWFIVPKLALAVDQLPLPNSLKAHLDEMLVPMIRDMSEWLKRDRLIPSQGKEVLHYFIDNSCWTDIGCANGAKMWKSYVSPKASIPFAIWSELCKYCLEDEIRKFADGINWNDCREIFRCYYPIYWYYKVYGEFPTERATQSSTIHGCALGYQSILKQGAHMILHLEDYHPRYHAMPPHVSALVYMRKEMNEKNSPVRYFEYIYDSVNAIHQLRHREAGEHITQIEFDILRCLHEWPGVLFIDSWIGSLDKMFTDSFFEMFSAFGEDSMAIDPRFLNKTHYKPAEKVWKMFYTKYCDDEQTLWEGFMNIFSFYNPTLCAVMFEGLDDEQRKYFLRIFEIEITIFHVTELAINDGMAFVPIFSDKILKNDEERQRFLNMWEEMKEVSDDFFYGES